MLRLKLKPGGYVDIDGPSRVYNAGKHNMKVAIEAEESVNIRRSDIKKARVEGESAPDPGEGSQNESVPGHNG